MKNEEIRKQVNKKIFLIRSFLYTSSLPPGEGPDSALKHSTSSHFLQSVVLELIIKMIYELSLKKAAPYSHNVLKMYNDLDKQARKFLEERFNQARDRKKKMFSEIDKSVIFHSLTDVLDSNEKTIKNFKYDAWERKLTLQPI